ncbi:MAG TPA: YciI family protein [Actinokineospora sp.]|nr:YciI family protein [Actinokineospora sp.]
MRYMVFVNMADDIGAPPPALVEAMGSEMTKMFAAGSMLDAGGLYTNSECTEVRLADGAVSVTDGPYAEAKEVVGGYAIIEARSHEEAVEGAHRLIQIHRDHWPSWEGSVHVRRIAGPDDGPPPRD